MILGDLIKVMKAGETLKDPAKWKKGQVLSNAVVGLITGGIALIKWKFPEVEIPQAVSDYAVETLTGLLVVINMYWTTGTSKKVGMK